MNFLTAMSPCRSSNALTSFWAAFSTYQCVYSATLIVPVAVFFVSVDQKHSRPLAFIAAPGVAGRRRVLAPPRAVETSTALRFTSLETKSPLRW